MELLKRPFDGAQSYVVCDTSTVAFDETEENRQSIEQQEVSLVSFKKLDGLEV